MSDDHRGQRGQRGQRGRPWRAGCGALALAALGAAQVARATEAPTDPWVLDGDLGLSLERTQAVAPGAAARHRVLPYAYADDGPWFAREDTFGVKLRPLGWGAFELVGRFSTEGSDDDGPGLAHRANPRPVGVGTFQETPWGGVFLDAFADTVSGGGLLEASYAAEFRFGPVTLYPQAGAAWRSARYVSHLYGEPAGRGDPGRSTWQAGSATTPMAALSGEWSLGDRWVLTCHVERERFGAAIGASPRVQAAGRTTALLAFSRRFR